MSRDGSATLPALDRAELLGLCGGDAKLAAELLRLFVRDALPDAARLAAIVDDGERAAVAHRLRGAALAIGAGEMADTAARIEAGMPADAMAGPLARLRAALAGEAGG